MEFHHLRLCSQAFSTRTCIGGPPAVLSTKKMQYMPPLAVFSRLLLCGSCTHHAHEKHKPNTINKSAYTLYTLLRVARRTLPVAPPFLKALIGGLAQRSKVPSVWPVRLYKIATPWDRIRVVSHSDRQYRRRSTGEASTKQRLPGIESGSCHIPTDNTVGDPQARPQVVKTAASETSAFFRESLFCRGELATLTVLMTAVPVRQ